MNFMDMYSYSPGKEMERRELKGLLGLVTRLSWI